jgi:hypothetical protein
MVELQEIYFVNLVRKPWITILVRLKPEAF